MKKLSMILALIMMTSIMTACKPLRYEDGEDKYDLLAIYQDLGEQKTAIQSLARDTHDAWYYAMNTKILEHSVSDLSSEVSLLSKDLNAEPCDKVYRGSIKASVLCVIESHKALGSYDSIGDALKSIDDTIKAQGSLGFENFDKSELRRLDALRDYHSRLVSYLKYLEEDVGGTFMMFENEVDSFNKQLSIVEAMIEPAS